jgi:hypothetical protein
MQDKQIGKISNNVNVNTEEQFLNNDFNILQTTYLAIIGGNHLNFVCFQLCLIAVNSSEIFLLQNLSPCKICSLNLNMQLYSINNTIFWLYCILKYFWSNLNPTQTSVKASLFVKRYSTLSYVAKLSKMFFQLPGGCGPRNFSDKSNGQTLVLLTCLILTSFHGGEISYTSLSHS